MVSKTTLQPPTPEKWELLIFLLKSDEFSKI
jgi:hypothetical protein